MSAANEEAVAVVAAAAATVTAAAGEVVGAATQGTATAAREVAVVALSAVVRVEREDALGQTALGRPTIDVPWPQVDGARGTADKRVAATRTLLSPELQATVVP